MAEPIANFTADADHVFTRILPERCMHVDSPHGRGIMHRPDCPCAVAAAHAADGTRIGS